ncbi:alpha/beta hydrolase [uncultured Enterovirga sp.]|uniref:alpha/beta hydrolase n=1 Tax=uncultured Enterovirga sp. TaxID=2026352 RepID=UPI0035CBFE16
MQTVVGRVVLSIMLWIGQLYPLARGNRSTARKSLRTIEASGRKVKVRIFTPRTSARGVILDLHGGGWTIGNARMSDGENGAFAQRNSLAVVSIDYRLALTNPISTSVDDCETAALWLIEHAETEFGTREIIVKGSSAGAHLAALMILRLRDAGRLSDVIKGLVLYFGLYDFSGTGMVRAAGSDNLLLHGPTVRSTLRKLTPHMTDEERHAPSISPVYGDLSSLPPALFLVGDKDMLLEDNQRMEARWRAANGNSSLLVVPESPHAFNRLPTAIARKVDRFVDRWMLERLS